MKARSGKPGTIVDATIIDAPPSTKNAVKARDPGMKQSKKNAREWCCGMKAHGETDTNGLLTTYGGASEFIELRNRLHGQARVLRRPGLREQHAPLRGRQHKVRYRMNRRPRPQRKLSAYDKRDLVRRRLMPA